MKYSTKKIGGFLEKLVCEYLQTRGLKLITTNYRCLCGEIDLIMKDDEVIVFIEVRHRKNSKYGDGAASVISIKQRKIINTATYYLAKNNLINGSLCRFDVVSTCGGSDNNKIKWIKNAFWANSISY